MAKIRAVFPLLVVATLLLTGCFRQADDSFEPVTVDDGTPDTTDGNTGDQPTSEVPLFTIEPTDSGADGDDVDSAQSGPTATMPLVITVAVTNTPPAVSIVTTTPEESGTEFITPGAPPGLIVTNTPDPNATATTVPAGDDDDSDTSISTDPTLSALTTPENVDPDCIYTVSSGDTLYRIALSNDTSVDRILAVNPDLGSGTFIVPGDEIVLPDCDPDAEPEEDEEEETPEATVSATESAPVEGTIHRVSAGDTLYGIALRYGVTVNSIINANPDLGDPNRLRIGQELVIPTD